MPMQPGFYPFWFWNGPLDEDEICWQIDQMCRQGIRGCFIHPRQGLRVPYLSERFFDLVRCAIDYAARRGLRVQLYDEFPYPSGPAGGLAILGQPWHQATRLEQGCEDVSGGSIRRRLPPGLVLNCAAYPLRDSAVAWDEGRDLRAHVGVAYATDTYQETGLTDYNRRRYGAADPHPVLLVELPEGRHRLFWSVQVVVSDMKYFGHDLDVLNPAAVERFLTLTHDRYARELGARLGTSVDSIFIDETAPHWSHTLLEAFVAEYGEDLGPLLPALQDDTHPRRRDVRRALFELRYQLFCEHFERAYCERCRRLGLAYTGEKPSLRVSQLAWMDLPGCDPGHVKVGRPLDLLQGTLRGNARAVASVVWLYGKAAGICECFHSTGWGATLQDARYVAEGLVLLGVETLVPHGFFASTHGLAKHDAPPTYFFQVPYWRHFHHLGRRLDRLTARYRGRPHADLLIIDPTPGLAEAEHRDAFAALQARCMAHHLQFLVADLAMLATGRLEAGAVVFDGPGLRITTILVPEMPDPEPGLDVWLAAFADQGGQVIAAAVFPDMVADFASALPIAGIGHEEVWLGTRTDPDGRRWHLLINQGAQPVDLRLPEYVDEEPLDVWLPPLLETTTVGAQRHLAPGASCLLCERPRSAAHPPAVTVDIGGVCRVVPDRSNLLRLDRWDLCLHGNAEVPDQRREQVACLPVAELIDRHDLWLGPELHRAFLTAPRLGLPKLSLTYTARFMCDCTSPVWVVVEPGSLVGDWRLRCNQASWLGPEDLRLGDHHVRGSLCAPLALRLGVNTVTIELHSDASDGGLRNPLYLAGDFAVDLDGPCLRPRCETGRFEAWEANGLPHYAGEVTYVFECPIAALPPTGGVLLGLRTEVPWEDAAEVRCNGGAWHPMPWEPRRAMVAVEDLRVGVNRIEVRAATTLLRAFEGQRFDPVRHAYVPVESGRRD